MSDPAADYLHAAGNYAVCLHDLMALARNPESDVFQTALTDLIAARANLIGWAHTLERWTSDGLAASLERS